MSEQDGLICAYMLDGKGGGQAVGWTDVRGWRPEAGPVWIHLDRAKDNSEQWVRQEAGLDPVRVAPERRDRAAHRDRLGGRGMMRCPGWLVDRELAGHGRSVRPAQDPGGASVARRAASRSRGSKPSSRRALSLVAQ